MGYTPAKGQSSNQAPYGAQIAKTANGQVIRLNFRQRRGCGKTHLHDRPRFGVLIPKSCPWPSDPAQAGFSAMLGHGGMHCPALTTRVIPHHQRLMLHALASNCFKPPGSGPVGQIVQNCGRRFVPPRPGNSRPEAGACRGGIAGTRSKFPVSDIHHNCNCTVSDCFFVYIP